MSGGVSTRLHAQYLPQGKEKLFFIERHPLSQKKKLFTSACTLLRLNRTKQILRWNHVASEVQLPPSLKPVKALSQMTPIWKKMRSVAHFLRYSSLKCSKQTFTVRSAIVNSFTSSVFPSEANGETEKKVFLSCGRFHSLLVAFRNSKSRRHSEIKQTRPSTKQDFSAKALSKQNTEASLASLSCNSSRAPTEGSAIFAFGVYICYLKFVSSLNVFRTKIY